MFAIVLPYLLQPLTHGGIAAITRADALEEVLAVQVLEEVVLFGQCQERLEPVRQGIWRRDAALRLRDIHSCHSFCAPRCKQEGTADRLEEHGCTGNVSGSTFARGHGRLSSPKKSAKASEPRDNAGHNGARRNLQQVLVFLLWHVAVGRSFGMPCGREARTRALLAVVMLRTPLHKGNNDKLQAITISQPSTPTLVQGMHASALAGLATASVPNNHPCMDHNSKDAVNRQCGSTPQCDIPLLLGRHSACCDALAQRTAMQMMSMGEGHTAPL